MHRPAKEAAPKAKAGPAKGVVVEGRVQQLTPGFAMLKLMDTSVPYCGEEEPEEQPSEDPVPG